MWDDCYGFVRERQVSSREAACGGCSSERVPDVTALCASRPRDETIPRTDDVESLVQTLSAHVLSNGCGMRAEAPVPSNVD